MNDVAVTPTDTESLPPNWCMATIGDLAEYVNRGRAPSYVDESAMPVINQRCIRWHGIEFDYVKYTDDSKAKNLAEEQFLKSGDVLWNSTGTGTIGRATVFRPTARFSRWVVDTHVTIVRSTHYVPELLYYWIASAEIQNQIGEMQLGSTNQVELSRERVLNTLVPVPPRSEQERIVAKIDELFSELDAGVASLKRARALLKKYRQAVLKAAVTGELTRDWRERHQGEIEETGAELLQRILKARREAWEAAELAKLRAKGKPPKDDGWKQKYKEPQPPDPTGLPALPEGWAWATVLQISSRVTDGTHQSPDFVMSGIPFIIINDVTSGRIDWGNVSKWVTRETFEACTARCRPELGDVLYTAVGSYGIAIEVVTDGEFMFQRHIAHIKPLHEHLNSAYFALVLNSPMSLRRAHKVARGVAQKTVTLGELACFPVPLPPFADRRQSRARQRD
jgi:type I restriction enzyme S subunit